MKLINADKVIEKLKEHKSLFCKNRYEFRALSDKDKARVDEIDTCIAELVNAEEVPPAQLGTNLAEVGTDCISRQAVIEVIDSFNVFESRSDQIKLEQMIGELPPVQPEPSQVAKDIARILENEQDMRVIAQPEIIRCKDCKHWIPYDWMFSEVWQSKNIADYPEDEIGCDCCDMAMKANDFCSRGERKEVTT